MWFSLWYPLRYKHILPGNKCVCWASGKLGLVSSLLLINFLTCLVTLLTLVFLEHSSTFDRSFFFNESKKFLYCDTLENVIKALLLKCFKSKYHYICVCRCLSPFKYDLVCKTMDLSDCLQASQFCEILSFSCFIMW